MNPTALTVTITAGLDPDRDVLTYTAILRIDGVGGCTAVGLTPARATAEAYRVLGVAHPSAIHTSRWWSTTPGVSCP